MATAEEKVAMYREKAKDKSLPQDVRNAYLDKATALEYKAYEETKAGSTKSSTPPQPSKMAKGGAVKKAMMPKGSAIKKGAKSPAIAIVIGMAKPKGKATMMNKGGMAKGKK